MFTIEKVNPIKIKDITEISQLYRCLYRYIIGGPCTPAEGKKAKLVIVHRLGKVIWKFNKYIADHFDL